MVQPATADQVQRARDLAAGLERKYRQSTPGSAEEKWYGLLFDIFTYGEMHSGKHYHKIKTPDDGTPDPQQMLKDIQEVGDAQKLAGAQSVNDFFGVLQKWGNPQLKEMQDAATPPEKGKIKEILLNRGGLPLFETYQQELIIEHYMPPFPTEKSQGIQRGFIAAEAINDLKSLNDKQSRRWHSLVAGVGLMATGVAAIPGIPRANELKSRLTQPVKHSLQITEELAEERKDAAIEAIKMPLPAMQFNDWKKQINELDKKGREAIAAWEKAMQNRQDKGLPNYQQEMQSWEQAHNWKGWEYIPWVIGAGIAVSGLGLAVGTPKSRQALKDAENDADPHFKALKKFSADMAENMARGVEPLLTQIAEQSQVKGTSPRL